MKSFMLGDFRAFLEKVFDAHPRVEGAAKMLGIRRPTLIVIPLDDVRIHEQVIVPDTKLRDEARKVLRTASRDLRVVDGPDTVLVVASAQ